MRATSFTELVGCTVPVQQAPIGHAAAVPDLAAAVAAAGGHGMLAGVGMPATMLQARLQLLGARTRAFGVNFIQPLAAPDALEVAAERAPLVELYLGPPAPELVDRFHRGGAFVSRQVTSAEEARSAQDEGCDLIVARGIEAGGRFDRGIGLIPLLDAVLEAVDVPVVAAGGIATARGVAAVLAMGAAAARVGTRFLLADEAATHPVHAEAILAARAEDAVVTDRFSHGIPATPHRVVRSALEAADAFEGETVAEMTLGEDLVAIPRWSPHNPAPDAAGRVEAMALYAGQSAGMVRRRQPAAEIVAELAAGVPAAAA